MSSQQPIFTRSLWGRIRLALGKAPRRGKGESRRKLVLESLESRALLSVSIAPSITGVVYQDASGTGAALTSGDTRLAGATVSLYKDGGDGNFEGKSGGDDSFIGSTTTNSSGAYSFNNLGVGAYWVQESGVSNFVASQSVYEAVITSADLTGSPGTMIDAFNVTAQYASDSLHGGHQGSVASSATEALGGYAGLYTQLITATGAVSIGTNSDQPGVLDFSANAASTGDYWINWDGNNTNTAQINPTGLGAQDITSNSSSTGIEFAIGADHPGATVVVKVYSDANDWSIASAAIPNTNDGSLGPMIFIPFSNFATGSGNGANFSDVGAIQMSIAGNVPAIDGELGPVQAFGPTTFKANFANIAESDLQIVKSASPSPVTAGQQLTYTLTSTNNGPSNDTGVIVSDPLPAGVTYVSSSTTQGSASFANGVLTDTLGNLAVGASPTTTIVVAVNSGASGTIANTATITGNLPDPNSNNNTSTVSTPINTSVDVALTKAGSIVPVTAGTTTTYTLKATNNGPSDATGVTIVDSLPTGETYASAGGAGTATVSNGQVSIALGNLAAGASETSTITVNIASTAPSTITNTAIVSEQQTDSVPSNNTATYTLSVTPEAPAAFPDLHITKVGTPSPVNTGSNLTYTLNVTNRSLTTATGATVSDPLPAGETFVSVSSSMGTGFISGHTVIVSLGTMVGQASATITIVVHVTAAAGSSLSNIATVTENETDAYYPDNTAMAVTPVTKVASKFNLLAWN